MKSYLILFFILLLDIIAIVVNFIMIGTYPFLSIVLIDVIIALVLVPFNWGGYHVFKDLKDSKCEKS